MSDDGTATDPCALVEPAVALAREAGERIMAIYEGGFSVAEKADRTPMTEADMAAHRTIVEGLQRLTPGLPVLSEESAEIPFGERARWRTYWLVDPLDGTREFIKRNGEFTVNIALVRDHEPVLGVVHAPALGLTYWACRGGGAWKQAGGEAPRRIHVRRARPGRAVVAGSRSHSDERLAAYCERLGPHELVSMGSALKSCLVAEGRADVYPRFGPTSEWDTAAAQCIVEEAGGRVVDAAGRPLRYNTKPSLLNPDFLVYGDPAGDWLRPVRDAVLER